MIFPTEHLQVFPDGIAQTTILRNITCPYCGNPISAQPSNKEHVVGRNFVPKGSLQKSWNLIVQAHVACNHFKSDLEDDLSAISLQPDVSGNHSRDDEALRQEAKRKGRSWNRMVGKRVHESHTNIDLILSTEERAAIKLGITGPPSTQPDRAFALAKMHLMAFWYLLTYDGADGSAGWWPGVYAPIEMAHRSDWGNDRFIWFMREAREWEMRLVTSFANGFYKVAIRKHPSAPIWSWAFEWNENIRLIGFSGDKEQIQSRTVPPLRHDHEFRNTKNDFLRIRLEKSLESTSDVLFAME